MSDLQREELTATTQNNRIQSLDYLRGIAILGILFINIENFAYPDAWSPSKFGFESPLDHSVRFWVYFLTQGKFYTMFTLLFGVGFYIFLERLEKKGSGLKAMDIYARRLLWLFVIGVIHAYFIWDGDVLYHYAICGFLLLPFRSISSKSLAAVVCLLAFLLLATDYQRTSARITSYSKYEQALELPKNELSEEDQKRIASWQSRLEKKNPDKGDYNPKKETYLIGLKETYENASVHKGQWYHKGLLFRSLLVMILGIILYKSGIFNNYKVWKNYWTISITLMVVGLLINYIRYDHWTYHYNEPVLSYWKSTLFVFPKEVLGVSYALILNGFFQEYLQTIKLKLISTIGQIALSNYIFQNVLLGLIFYGYGLGKYNQYARHELLGIVLIIWSIQLGLSWIWTRRYKRGPLEHIWRKLTYSGFKL